MATQSKSKSPKPQAPFAWPTATLFRGLGPAELDDVLAAGRSLEVKAGQELFHQEDEAKSFYTLASGQVKLVQNTPDGRQVTLRYIGPGEPIGIVSVLETSQYPATAQVVERGAAYRWDRAAFRRMMEAHPRIALNAIPFLISRVHEVQERFRELATERVERRIARSLLRIVRQTGKKTADGVDVGMPLSRQDIAEMNGTTLFTVSRVLSQWEHAGYVRVGRRRVVILRPHDIVRLAEDLPAEELPAGKA